MLNPSAHVQWKVSEADQLRFSVARTVRRPSIDQLIPAFSLESPGDEDATIGNPDLDFETSIGLDLGYERSLPDRGIFGINLFYRDISDLIGLVHTGLPVSDIGLDPEDFPRSLYTYRNLSDARVHAVELDLSTPLSFIGLPETCLFPHYTPLLSSLSAPPPRPTPPFHYPPTSLSNPPLPPN